MKKIFYFALACLVLVACNEKKQQSVQDSIDEPEPNDSTIYGVCGEGSMMHTLELITNMQDTLSIRLFDEDSDEPSLVAGGMMSGDRMAVTARQIDGEWTAQRVINITSLLGKWSSIDKSFELTDDGEVISDVKAETQSWTQWRILNGHLLLNRDTFDIVTLGADSLEMENHDGIFLYKRVRASSSQN